ncbi:MAG: putative selenium-dependent hydroxylase accessory protein YqeC [Gammaproteobacteria bacterium]|nr:putative selenium-dependent hydroxylase accessory protein YqeC [Gammaproteobacteria bacterium]
MYWLAALHPGRVGLTASVHTPPYPAGSADRIVYGDETEVRTAVTAAGNVRVVAFAGPGDKPRRHAGFDGAFIRATVAAAGFDLCLVKADGARARWIKAPGPGEPRIVADADTVIVVAAARAIGQCLSDRIAHRPERIAALTGCVVGAVLTPAHLGLLLAHPHGGLADVGRARVVPLINMVDDAALAAPARDAARAALAATTRFDRIVLACARRREIVEIVER